MTIMESVELERERISLLIQAFVVPYRIELERNDPEVSAMYRGRAHALLDYLNEAVGPYPDLQDDLAAARAELRQAVRGQH